MPIRTDVYRLQRRRTKIVATLGPASSAPDLIEALIGAGVDVFRLNLSHGDHAGHRKVHRRVRKTAERVGKSVGILADLCGPKIRVGRFPDGEIFLEEGAEVTVTTRQVAGEPGLIPSRYEALHRDVSSGDRILLDDGNLELRVEAVEETEVRCEVVTGGVLRDGKGINLPGVRISAPSLTEKDRRDARFVLELGVEFLALSFVRRAEDVRELLEVVGAVDGAAAIVAKIEKPEALDDIDRIIEAADGIMVARGDLGVELPPEAVPNAQRQLVDLARRRGRPVIVATQMLESMVESPRPTRAEVSDVAGAVWSGADAVMLSAETAVGRYPVQTVEIMDRVARDTEGYLWEQGAFGSMGVSEGERPLRLEDAVARATGRLSRDLMVRAIVVVTETGWSAAMVSAARPQAPVLAASANPVACGRMSLLWGVVPVQVESGRLDDPVRLAREVARSEGLAESGHHVLLVRGFHSDPAENIPSVTVVTI